MSFTFWAVVAPKRLKFFFNVKRKQVLNQIFRESDPLLIKYQKYYQVNSKTK